MAQNIKINGVTFTDVDYIQVPKADGSGVAVYRDLDNYRSALNIAELIAGTATDINDVNGEVTGNVSSLVFNGYTALVSVTLPYATSTSGTCFQNCSNLETVKLNSCKTLGQSSLRALGKLTLAELDEATSLGNNCFDTSSQFGTLVIGKNSVAVLGSNVFPNTKISGGTGKIYVYADLIPLYRGYGGWASYITQMEIAEKYYDVTALEYKVTVTPPTGCNPYVKYTTNKGEWYGRNRSIAGGETDVIHYVASCYGFADKSGSISIDSSNPAISLDLTDMVVDGNFNGYNITNLDFTNAEINFSNNCTLTLTTFSDWYYHINKIKGIDGFTNSKYLILTQTIPSTSGMTTPTVVWEALVDMTGTEGSARKTMYSCGSASASAIVVVGAADVNLFRNSTNNVVSDLDLTDGWHHIGVVVNATNSYIYVDGELKLTVSDTGMYAQFTAATHRLGHRWSSTGDYFLGRLKKLAVCIRDISDPTLVFNCRFLLLQEIQS